MRDNSSNVIEVPYKNATIEHLKKFLVSSLQKVSVFVTCFETFKKLQFRTFYSLLVLNTSVFHVVEYLQKLKERSWCLCSEMMMKSNFS